MAQATRHCVLKGIKKGRPFGLPFKKDLRKSEAIRPKAGQEGQQVGGRDGPIAIQISWAIVRSSAIEIT